MGQLMADVIVMPNGDKLFGKIQNQFFAVYSPYGQIVIRNDFSKRITFDFNKPAHCSIQTINNDIFSGTVLLDEFEILQDNGELRSVDKNNIQMIRMDRPGPSYMINTSIFIMKNGDKFSGKLLTTDMKIRADSGVTPLSGESLNRIEMLDENPGNASILLNNGDLITGELIVEQLQIVPDSTGQLNFSKSTISTIQFNADKMVLNEFSRLEKSSMDSDGDGIADHLDHCPGSPFGKNVDENGCSKDPGRTLGHAAPDRDKDGIPDENDLCPETPQNIPVDDKGCAVQKDILFEFDKYTLQSEYHQFLDQIAALLKKNPLIKIEIQGHTDNVGTPQYNMELSLKRARAVQDYLANRGIDAKRISAKGYGAKMGKTTNATAEGRALNRRTTIVYAK